MDSEASEDDMWMSSDELLSCLIYVLVKARATDAPALLTFVSYFTLERLQDSFEYVSTTAQAAILFIRTELSKLCEPTLHYTYVDGKSYLGDKQELYNRTASEVAAPVDPYGSEAFMNDLRHEAQLAELKPFTRQRSCHYKKI